MRRIKFISFLGGSGGMLHERSCRHMFFQGVIFALFLDGFGQLPGGGDLLEQVPSLTILRNFSATPLSFKHSDKPPLLNCLSCWVKTITPIK